MITLESRNQPAQNHSALGPLRTRISLRTHTGTSACHFNICGPPENQLGLFSILDTNESNCRLVI